MGNPDAGLAVKGNVAGKDLTARRDVARDALAGDGRGVEIHVIVRFEHSVESHAVAGTHHRKVTYSSLARIYLTLSAGGGDNGDHVGHAVEQRADATAGFVGGIILEFLADGIEQQHGHPLGIFPDDEGTDRGEEHEGVFVEEIKAPPLADRPRDNGTGHRQQRHEIVPPHIRENMKMTQQNAREQQSKREQFGRVLFQETAFVGMGMVMMAMLAAHSFQYLGLSYTKILKTRRTSCAHYLPRAS